MKQTDSRRRGWLLAAGMAGLLLLTIANRELSSDPRDWLYAPLGVAGSGMALLLCGWQLRHPALDRALPLWAFGGALVALLAAGQLLWRIDAGLLEWLPDAVGHLFQAAWFPALGLALAVTVCLPIARQLLRRQPLRALGHDLAVLGGLLALAALIYLPHGFHSVGNYESWTFRAWVEGMFSWSVAHEVITRPFTTLPHFVGSLLSPASFAAYHALNLLFIWGKAALFYGILRRLGIAALFAWLLALLAMLYPVNSLLFTLRSLPIEMSAVGLMGALFLALDAGKSLNRLRLAGIWAGLAFCVYANEGGYVLILALPLLWLCRERGWRERNLALCWLLVPAGKVAYMLLLSANRRAFYYDNLFEGFVTGAAGGGIGNALPNLLAVYRYTFMDGWRESLDSLLGGAWTGAALAALAMAASVSWLLARGGQQPQLPDARWLGKGLPLGIALILPAVGVFIFIEQYGGDLWRMYYYVPEGAAIAVFCAAGWLCRALRPNLRVMALCALCLALTLPAFAHAIHKRGLDVQRAANKAEIMRSLVAAAPRIHEGAAVMLTTRLSKARLLETDFAEFYMSKDMDRSFYYLIYGGETAPHAYFCRQDGFCRANPDEPTLYNSDSPEELLARTLIFELREDLTAALIADPAGYPGWHAALDYDASRLFYADADSPARAKTMLAPFDLPVGSGGGDTPLSPPVGSGGGATPLSPPVGSGGGATPLSPPVGSGGGDTPLNPPVGSGGGATPLSPPVGSGGG